MARKLKPEERELWTKVADTATPLNPPKKTGFDPDFMQAPVKRVAVEKHMPLQPFKIGSKAKPKTAIEAAQNKIAPTMDAKSFGKLSRGKMRPEARIDLHGLTLAEAHPALMDFILGSVQLQRRLVLVITGKGKQKADLGPIPERHGVLRHQVPLWLRQAPLTGHILEITTSHQRHGGAGALYVYLRRRR